MSKEIEKLIDDENWDGARAVIEADLKDEPNSHWLLTRLALTFYEQRNYEKALEIGKEALEIEPNCPLALWDYAGTLQMLGRDKEASVIYTHLIKRGVKSVAHGDCGEGTDWASALLLDCTYRRALSYINQKRNSEAKKDLNCFIEQRPTTLQSIYTVKQAKNKLNEI